MKYIGSKSKIASYILPFIHNYIMLNNIDTYIEPFVGGANIVDKVQCTNRIAYDKDKYIIALFKHLQSGGELPENISREQYADCREHYIAKDKYYEDWYLAAVGFIASSNGKFFDKSSAIVGWDKEHYIKSKESILIQMKSLQDVTFGVSDYKSIKTVKNSIIYADPPSLKTKTFNINEFWNKVREWNKDSIVLISEKTAPEDFDILWEDGNNEEKIFIQRDINISKSPLTFDF